MSSKVFQRGVYKVIDSFGTDRIYVSDFLCRCVDKLPILMKLVLCSRNHGLVYMDCHNTYFVMLQKLSLVNGVIFTGGRAKRGLYVQVVESIFKVHTISRFLVNIGCNNLSPF